MKTITGPGYVALAVMAGIFVGGIYLTGPELLPFTDAYAARVERERVEAEKAAAEKARMDAWANRLTAAHVSCTEAVARRSKFPSAARFEREIADIVRQASYPPDAKRITLTGRAILMNEFGASIPHRYACDIDVPKWRLLNVAVSPG